jgi:LysR family hydrogen peroxide-inducible transcriptional activator
MTLDQLRYALELQRTRHFSQAAESCFITQPSLSVQISKLEEELGVQIFVRSRAGVEVTDYGELLLKQARLIVEEAQRLPQMAHDLKGEVRGTFRLGIISTLAPSLLPLFASSFGQKYPHVQLIITEDRTESLVSEIDYGQLDGAILSTPLRCPASLIEKVLFYEPFVVFGSTGHPILEKKKVSLEQISSDEILLLDETHCLRDQVLQLCKPKRENSAAQASNGQKLQFQSTSLQTLIEIIRHNQGYTLLPILSVGLLSNTERTKNIRAVEKPIPSRKVSLVFHQARLKRSIVEALQECIVASLPEQVFLTTAKQNLRVLSPSLEHFEV